MKARVGAGAALLTLIAMAGWFGHAWREEQAASARAAREASLVVSAQLHQLDRKVDRLERALSAARADTLAACAPRAVQAAPSLVASVRAEATPSEAEPNEANGGAEQLASAEREVDEAIRRGRWSVADGARFESTIAPLQGELRDHALGRLSQAINAGRLDHESGAFPF